MAVRSGRENPSSPRTTAHAADLRLESERLRSLLLPVVEKHDLYLEAVEVRSAGSHRTVHVIVDLIEDSTGSLGLDVLSAVSRDLSLAMDEDPEDDGRAYDLEISSPGVSRPLTEPRHWRRNVGRLVTVTPIHGDDTTGRLLSVAADGINLRPQIQGKKGTKPRTGEDLFLEFAKIRQGTVQVEFTHLDDEHHEDHGAAPDDSGTAHPA